MEKKLNKEEKIEDKQKVSSVASVEWVSGTWVRNNGAQFYVVGTDGSFKVGNFETYSGGSLSINGNKATCVGFSNGMQMTATFTKKSDTTANLSMRISNPSYPGMEQTETTGVVKK